MLLTGTIVTYNNNIDVLTKTIMSFFNTKIDVKLYIVDNSNSKYIKNFCSKINFNIEYIPLKKNIGFGAGHNVVMREPAKLGKYHLVLNPDITFEKGVLEELISYMENNSLVGNVMPKVLYPDGSMQYLCKLLPRPLDWIGRLIIPWKSIKNRISYRFEMRFTDYNTINNVPYLSGCFMLLRKESILNVGLFDERIFMYGEDTDLNRRIGKEYLTIYYPNVKITHEFAKASHKELRLLVIHIKAAIYYFNKWGWFNDKERDRINNEIIKKYQKK